MAPSRGQDGQNTINTGKCPRQPRSGSIVHTHRSGSWETETVKRYDEKSAKSRRSSFKAYYLKDQLSAANTPIGRIKSDVRAPGSTAKISGRRAPRQKKIFKAPGIEMIRLRVPQPKCRASWAPGDALLPLDSELIR